MIESLSETKQSLTLDDVQFHPKVREELQIELSKWVTHLESVSPENLPAVQARVQMLRWVTGKMLDEVIAKSKPKPIANSRL